MLASMTEGSAPIARVLVVDDELTHALLTARLVRQLGYAAEIATNEREALSKLHDSLSASQNNLEVLITDLHLDGLRGIGLLRDALVLDESLAVIVLTGFGSVDTAVEAMRQGATDYIEKPLSAAALGPILSKALAGRRLKRENSILQARVRERTRELEDANRELQAANIELEAFARTVSHDVRNPLHAMVGFAELLHSEGPGALNITQKKYLLEIFNSGNRLDQLTRHLLELAQLGCGSLTKADVDVTDIVNEVIGELRTHYPDRQVQIDVGPLPEVMADRTLLRQVFFNLLDNAFKFTAERRDAHVEVSGTRQPGWCVYEVCDNGVGFDEHHVASPFALFSRLHPADRFKGTGIGLSVVRRIVERHQGQVTARGTEGEGAGIRISLPC